jgi:hypothetical protein
MKRKNFLIWLFVIVFFSGMLGITRTVFAETVKVGGTGFAVGVIRIVAESFENSTLG